MLKLNIEAKKLCVAQTKNMLHSSDFPSDNALAKFTNSTSAAAMSYLASCIFCTGSFGIFCLQKLLRLSANEHEKKMLKLHCRYRECYTNQNVMAFPGLHKCMQM